MTLALGRVKRLFKDFHNKFFTYISKNKMVSDAEIVCKN